MTAEQPPAAGPEAMRAALRSYVAALHHAYLGVAALLPPGERAALPLLRAGEFTVVVAAARYLHVLATADPLPVPHGQEVAEHDTDGDGDLAWVVRFYDPVVLPALALVQEPGPPASGDVRRVIGITDVIYHLSVAPGGGLAPHHAQHAGTGLANQHAAAVRDADTLRAALRGREAIVDEFAVAERLGLHHAVRMLAAALAPDNPDVARAAAGDDDTAIRRALVASARPGRGRAVPGSPGRSPGPGRAGQPAGSQPAGRQGAS
jgi:hypothetical protein